MGMKTFRVELDEHDPGVRLAKAIAKTEKVPVKVVVQAMLSGWRTNITDPSWWEFWEFVKELPEDWREDPSEVARYEELSQACAEAGGDPLLKDPQGMGMGQIRVQAPMLASALDWHVEKYRMQRSERSRSAVNKRYEGKV